MLPFRGHFEFLRESLPSVLDQNGAETIVHLIDDATPGGADELLRYWGSHPRVRTYRNSRNLGQFVSFNNVFPYLETDLIAIQDADDISLPHRLHLAGNLLRLADADFFGDGSRRSNTVRPRKPSMNRSRPPTMVESKSLPTGPANTHAGMNEFTSYKTQPP